MKNQKIIAGIDLGSSKITCMIAKTSASPLRGEPQDSANNPAPEIIGAGISDTKGFSNGLVVDLELAAQSIKNATSLAETQAGVKLSELYIAITGAHIKGESSKASLSIPQDKEITPADVSQLVQQASTVDLPSHRTIIHSFPQEFILDDLPGIRDPIGMNANRLQASIYIVTATSTAIQNIQKAIDRAGFKTREFLPQSIAASYSVLDSNDQELGCMLIDIGGETTDVAAFHKGGIYDTLSLGLGGADITNDISIGLSISRYHAEQLKIKHGAARSDLAFSLSKKSKHSSAIKIQSLGKDIEQIIDKKSLISIIAPRIEEIFELLHRKLKYPADLELLPAGIILTGGAAKMPGISGLAERIFGIPAKIGTPNTVQSLNRYKDPSFATPIGLIIYGSIDKSALSENKKNGKMGTSLKAPLLSSFSNRVKKWLLE